MGTEVECNEFSDSTNDYRRCYTCDIVTCSECQSSEESVKIRTCDLCHCDFCPQCGVEFEWDASKICQICQDKLHITKANYESITQGINEAIKEAGNISGVDTTLGLGKLCGALNGLKNRFGF